MSVEKILYRLNCQHITLAPAFYVGGIIRCPLCHEDRKLVDVVELEWRTVCYVCKYARWAGMSEANATMFANAHVRRNPKHRVGVKREQHLAATKTRAKMDASGWFEVVGKRDFRTGEDGWYHDVEAERIQHGAEGFITFWEKGDILDTMVATFYHPASVFPKVDA